MLIVIYFFLRIASVGFIEKIINYRRLQMKKIIGLLLGVLMLTACNITERTNSVPKLVIPDFFAYVEIEKVIHTLVKGGFSWTEKISFGERTVMTDHLSPDQQAENMEAIIVAKGAEVKVSIEDKPDLAVFSWTDKGKESEITIKNDSFHVASEPGVYVYEIVATWKQGHQSYVLKVKVQ